MKTKTMTHTPGPWHAAGSYILAQRNPGGTKHHIAEASRDQPAQICLANAQLIAAAPELLEACEAACKAAADCLPPSGDGELDALYYKSKLQAIDEAANRCSAAIAKALRTYLTQT